MTIAHCPHCHEQVGVPSGISRQARVRCPLCSEEYVLEDALQSLPPFLVVIHDPVAETAAEFPDSTGFPAVLPRGHQIPTIAMDANSEELTFETGESVPAPPFKFESPAIPAARSSHVSRKPRTRRKPTSAMRLIVQTIGGGVIGLAIAQLILWWLPGKWDVNNRDPFRLAAKVADYVPFLVPSNLHGNVSTTQGKVAGTPSPDMTRVDTASVAGKPPTVETTGDEGSPIPEFTFNSSAPSESTNPAAGGNNNRTDKKSHAAAPEEFPLIGLHEPAEAGKSPSPAPDPLSIPKVTANASPSADQSAVQSKELTKKGSSAERDDPVPSPVVAAKPAVQEPHRLRNSPSIDVEEIPTRLAAVAAASLAWDDAENPSREQKVALITEIYTELAQLGDAIAVLGVNQPEATVAVNPVVDQLATLARQPDKLVHIGSLGARWINEHRDEGAVLVGVVLSHQPCGKLFETQVRLDSKSEPVVSVISDSDLSPQLPLDARVIVLGRLVSAPQKNLAGYEGNAPLVLLHGIHAPVPVAKP